MKSFSIHFCLASITLSLVLPHQAKGGGAIGMSNARATAMAGAYNGLALGSEAPFVNPANLSLKSQTRFSMTFFGVGLNAVNNSFSKSYYDRYNGAYLDQAAKNDILGALSENGLRMNSAAEVQALGVGYGPWAFSISAIGGAESTLAREIFDLVLNGNQENRTYSFKPAAAEGVALAAFAFSYGKAFNLSLKNVDQFGAGATLKYYRGLFYGKILHAQARMLTEFSAAEAEGSAEIRQAAGGNGFGLDLGATATVWKKWRASLTLHNLLSSVRWNRDTEAVFTDFELYSTNLEKLNSFDGEVDSVLVSNDTTKSISSFSTSIPTTLRLGVLRTFGEWMVAAEWEQGFKDGALSTKTPLFALGGEYRPWRILRLRMGTSLGGRQGFTIAYGLGFAFGPVRWDLAGVNYGGFTAGVSRGVGLATSISMRY